MPPAGSPKIVRIARQFFGTVGSDEKVVLDAQPSAAFPVHAGLDREHHALLDRAGAGPVRVRRLVCARADSMSDRMAGLTGVTRRRKAVADQDVELGEARTR